MYLVLFVTACRYLLWDRVQKGFRALGFLRDTSIQTALHSSNGVALSTQPDDSDTPGRPRVCTRERTAKLNS